MVAMDLVFSTSMCSLCSCGNLLVSETLACTFLIHTLISMLESSLKLEDGECSAFGEQSLYGCDAHPAEVFVLVHKVSITFVAEGQRVLQVLYTHRSSFAWTW